MNYVVKFLDVGVRHKHVMVMFLWNYPLRKERSNTKEVG